MTRFFARCLAMLAALLCGMQVALAGDIMVMNAVARASLTPNAKSGVIYLSVMNHGSTDDRLLSLSSPVATTAEVHHTQMDGDVMRMRTVEGGLLIAAGTTVDLKPGGLHIMLTGIKTALKEGETIVLELAFEKAGHLQIKVPIGAMTMEHLHKE